MIDFRDAEKKDSIEAFNKNVITYYLMVKAVENGYSLQLKNGVTITIEDDGKEWIKRSYDFCVDAFQLKTDILTLYSRFIANANDKVITVGVAGA